MSSSENNIGSFSQQKGEVVLSTWQILLEECYQQTVSVFKSEHAELGISMLPALRRLALIYRDDPANIIFTREEDLLFELNTGGIKCDRSEMIKGLSVVQELCSSYYSLAEVKANSIPFDSRLFDLAEMTDITKGVIDRIIWKTIDLDIGDPKKVAKRLNLSVRGNLSRIDGIMKMSLYPQRKIVQPIDELLFQNKIVTASEEERMTDTNFFIAFENLQFLARKHSLKDLTRYVAMLDPREKLAVLVYFGYFGTGIGRIGKSLKQFEIKLHILQGDLVRASVSLEEAMETYPVELVRQQRGKELSMWNFVGEINSLEFMKAGGKVVRHTSSRLQLIEAYGKGELDTIDLTDIEKRAILLAVKADGNKFTYTTKEMASLLGIKAVTVGHIFRKILNLSDKKENRFLNDNGKVIRLSSTQHKLIMLRKAELKTVQLSALSPLHREVFDLITTPDKKGRYLTRSQVMEDANIESDSIFSKIITNLKKGKTLEDLKKIQKGVEVAMENLESFSKDEKRILQFVYESLQVGQSLAAEHGRVGFTQIARELDLSPRMVRAFLKNFINKN